MALVSSHRRVILSAAAFFSAAKDLLLTVFRSARTWVPHVWLLRRGKATSLPPSCHPERAERVEGLAVALDKAAISTNLGAPSLRSKGGKVTNLPPSCHPERAERVEGLAVALDKGAISTNLGAPSLRSKGGKVTNPKITFALKFSQALLLAVAICFSLGATDSSSRYNNVNHRLMCTCGCAQLLGECNHVGCPASGPMLGELSAAIATGATDEQILSSFSAKYGVTVLAAPPTKGFSLVAWIAPFAVFAAALLGTILLVRHWSVGRAALPATQPVDPAMTALRDRIRRETEASDL